MVYISVNKASPFPPLIYAIHTLSQVYVGPLAVDFLSVEYPTINKLTTTTIKN